MGDEPLWRDDERALQLALFRYAVIGPLVERDDFERGEVSALVRHIATETRYLPGTGPVTVSERTVYAWLRLYRDGGIAALRPQPRKDRGTRRVVDDAVLERAVQLRKEGKKRTTTTLLDILRREGTLDGHPIPHRATLDRHLARRGASRRLLRTLSAKRTIKMAFERFGDLWVGDYHHGPVILGPDGRPVTAKLGAFIDHTTRYPVAHRYYLAEDLASLRDTMLRALLAWGLPRKAYVDRGAVYRSQQLAYSLALLGCRLIHSRAYYSQGRGVIERWWQIAGAFEDEVRLRDEPLTLHELNALWEAWCELRYCAAVHSELGRSPNDAVAEVERRPLDPEVARQLFLVTARRKVHASDGCVKVEGRRFLCESFLRGQRVQVRYDPRDLSSVLVFVDDRLVHRAFPQKPNAPPEPHPEPEDIAPSIDYLAMVREDYDRQLLEHARPLAYAKLDVDPTFGTDDFVRVVADLSGLQPRSAERRELVAFWQMWGPLPESLVRIGTEHAVRLHGRGRHPRVALAAIRTLILAHWRRPPRLEEEP